MESKFLKLYNLIMEELITSKSGIPKRIDKSSIEFNKALSDFKYLIENIVDILQNEFGDLINKNEKIEYTIKDNSYIIKCPNQIREKIMNKSSFLSEKIDDMINNGNLIKDDYIFRINDINNQDAKLDFDEVENETDDIELLKTSKSSAGEYFIPIIIQSDDNDNDFYKFKISLYAKPNTGRFGLRGGNVSITLAEFIPCHLWNINSSVNISIHEIIDIFSNLDVENSIYNNYSSSKEKIKNLVNYLKNFYENDPSKKIINGKIYGAIGIYRYMLENFSDYIGNQCIWTDIDSLKPSGYETNPGDIMIEKNDGKFISISLKTAANENEKPPIKNTTVNGFLNYCNMFTNSNDFDIIPNYFYPILNFAKNNNIFTDEEYNNIQSFISPKFNSRKLTQYVNNSDIVDKFTKIGELRDFAINKVIELANKAFPNKIDLINYLLQVQNGDPDFYILKAIEKEGAKPVPISLNFKVSDKVEVEKINTGFVITGLNIDGNPRKIKIDIRSKGHGLHEYFSYDFVGKLI